MIVISDTGPLIALAKIDQISLVKELFQEIHIPPAVQRELFAKRGSEVSHLEEAAREGFIKTTPLSPIPSEVQWVISRLGQGEQEAIALTHEQNALLLIDELLGRAAARRLDLDITGVVGILIRGKHEGHIIAVLPLLHALRQKGYWLSDEVLAVAAQYAAELPE